VILPVDEEQFDGLVLVDELITGVAFTVTVVDAEVDGQLILGEV